MAVSLPFKSDQEDAWRPCNRLQQGTTISLLESEESLFADPLRDERGASSLIIMAMLLEFSCIPGGIGGLEGESTQSEDQDVDWGSEAYR